MLNCPSSLQANLCHQLFVISENNECKALIQGQETISAVGFFCSELTFLSPSHLSLTSTMFRSQRLMHFCKKV